MPQRNNKVAIMAKIETTYGVDSTPAGADAMVVIEPNLSPLEGDSAERNIVRPYFGNSGTVRATSYRKLTFKCELSGSGTAGVAAPYVSTLLRACAVAVTVAVGTSVTLAPVTDSIESVTIYHNLDGVLAKMVGCRGKAKINLSAKGIPVIDFEFMGSYSPLTDSLIPAPTYTNWASPLAVNKANTTASLHGTAVAMQSFEMDLGNQLVKRDLVGVDAVEITDRKAMGSMNFEATKVVVKDWVGIAQAKATGPLSVVHGVTPGNIVTISSATTQFDAISYGDSDGIQMIDAKLNFQPTGAGNNEWSIVFT
jgi:Phage tail tube protein